MSGVIDREGRAWERCNGCGKYAPFEDMYNEPASEVFEKGREICPACRISSMKQDYIFLHHQDEIACLNSRQMEGKGPKELYVWMIENYSLKQIKVVKDHYNEGGSRMGDDVLMMGSWLSNA